MTQPTIVQRNMAKNNDIQLNLLPEVASALFSDCGQYRYILSQIWDKGRAPMVFVMLNPSTANDYSDNPTLRRCISFAQRENAGGMLMVNLYGYRTPYPEELKNTADPVGPENDRHLREVFAQAKTAGSKVVCAWGQPSKHLKRKQAVAQLIQDIGLQAYQLGEGPQKHPLYLAADVPLLPLNVNLLTPR